MVVLAAGGDHIPALTHEAFRVRKKKNRVISPDFQYLAVQPRPYRRGMID